MDLDQQSCKSSVTCIAHKPSIIDDFQLIAEREFPSSDQEIAETKCFHWHITNWRQLVNFVESPIMQAGGYDWNLRLYPRGLIQTDLVSLYLNLASLDDDPKAYASAQFILAVSRLSDPTDVYLRQAEQRYVREQRDWGFTMFLPIRKLTNDFLERDAVRISVIIRVLKDTKKKNMTIPKLLVTSQVQEQTPYITAIIANIDTFRHNTGADFAEFDERNARKNRTMIIRARKKIVFGELAQHIAKTFELRLSELRLWVMVRRLSHTVRIDLPILKKEYTSTMEEICEDYKYACNSNGCLRLYMEKATIYDKFQSPIFPPAPSPYVETEFILVFIKLFEPLYQSLQGVGSLYLQTKDALSNALDQVKKMTYYSDSAQILMYEEVNPTRLNLLDLNLTAEALELNNGDIICVQKRLTSEQEQQVLNNGGKLTVDEFLTSMPNKVNQ